MNYDELTCLVNALEKEKEQIERAVEAKIRRRDKKILDLKLRYIEEHQPLPLKRFQHIRVVARVTEESRKYMNDDARSMKKYQLGTTYTLVGPFNWYCIDESGEVVPCFYGKTDYRGRYDKVLSVQLTAYQPEGSCNKCRCARNGGCYMAGGSLRIFDIDEEKMVPCPNYEEVVEGGLYAIKGRVWPARYYPRVTIVHNQKGERKYRLYEGDWACFCEYEEEYIKTYYTHEPQDYGEEICKDKQ